MYSDLSLIDHEVSPFQVLEYRAADVKNQSIFLGVSAKSGKALPLLPGPWTKSEAGAVTHLVLGEYFSK